MKSFVEFNQSSDVQEKLTDIFMKESHSDEIHRAKLEFLEALEMDTVKVAGGYIAYELSAESRHLLLSKFPPKNPEVIAHHVTYKFPAKVGDEIPAKPSAAYVVGYAEEPGLEAVVVQIDGSTRRNDGKIFHVTLSLDRSMGKKPVDSNNLLSKGYQNVPHVKLDLTPKQIK